MRVLGKYTQQLLRKKRKIVSSRKRRSQVAGVRRLIQEWVLEFLSAEEIGALPPAGPESRRCGAPPDTGPTTE